MDTVESRVSRQLDKQSGEVVREARVSMCMSSSASFNVSVIKGT